jgi:hypothetical protein
VSIADTTSDRGDRTLDDHSVEADQRLHGDLAALREFAEELSLLRTSPSQMRERSTAELVEAGQAAYTSGHINVDPAAVEQSLAKLVLTLIEFIRQLLERQAIRRMEAGSLTDDEIERMGETFLRLEQRMEELKAAFDLQGEELNLSLGPLGNLLPEE